MAMRDFEKYKCKHAIVSVFLCYAAAAIALGSCAPSRKTTTTKPTAPPPSSPQIPQPTPAPPEAPVRISVTYPIPGQWKPAVDSNFIFGTVGNGNASFTINGTPVSL